MLDHQAQANVVITPEDIPEGQSGSVTVEKMHLTESFNVGGFQRPDYMRAGETLVMLKRDGNLVMSNTPDEVRSNYFHVPHEDRGKPLNILVGGLGLGCFLKGIQQKRTPHRVFVVEIDPDVIALVAPTYKPLPYFRVICDDIRDYARRGPPKHFDVAWIDIWGDYNTDLLPEMFAVRKSLGRVMKPGGGRVHIWREEDLKEARRRGC